MPAVMHQRPPAILQEISDRVGSEWGEWYGLSPEARWEESARLWHTYIALGGSLDPVPGSERAGDPQEVPAVLSSRAARCG